MESSQIYCEDIKRLSRFYRNNSGVVLVSLIQHRRVYPKVSGLSRQRNKQQQQQTLVEKQHKELWRQNPLDLTHKIATQLHPVAENCTICSSRSRRPVRKLFDTPSSHVM
jgi:hypothetical protein